MDYQAIYERGKRLAEDGLEMGNLTELSWLSKREFALGYIHGKPYTKDAQDRHVEAVKRIKAVFGWE